MSKTAANTDSSIRTKDGRSLAIRTYTPLQSSHKVMIIAPTGSVSSRLYEPFARFFRDQGYVVVAFDYRGIGDSAPEQLSGYQANMHQWAVQDIDAVIVHVKNQYSLHEIIYVGHCIGGEIIGLAQASQYISRLVLVSSALSCKKYWSWNSRFRLLGNNTLLKLMIGLYGFFPGRKFGMGNDLPGGVIREWSSWCRKPNGLFDLFPDNNYRKLSIPLRAYSFHDDWMCPPRAVRELLTRFSSATVSWQHIHPKDRGLKKIGHDGFFKAGMEEGLWRELDEWLG